jgi:hypothetical protein
MKPPVLAVLAALTLAACATTPTVYQPASSQSAVGYSEYRIEPGRYRVTFQGGSGAPPEQVMDFAIMRAADLALADGYDWFRISDRFLRRTGGSSGPRISLGVGGMDFGRRSSVGVGVGTGFDLGGGGSGGASAATIEVFMGRGPKPDGVDVYDAHAVRRTLGRPA